MHLRNLPSKLSIGMLSVVVMLGLSACGYQLRSANNLASLPASISIYADNQQLAKAMAKALAGAQVAVTITEHAVSSDNHTQSIADVRFTNTKVHQESVIYASNGDPTHWRYSISTQMLVGNDDNSNTFMLQEHQQVALNADSGAGSANDLIVTQTWQGLYQAVAQRALTILSRQP